MPESTDSQKTKDKKGEVEKRYSEATSKETLKDLERTDSKPGKSSEEKSVPSPDGTPDLDRSGGRADGSDTGDPM